MPIAKRTGAVLGTDGSVWGWGDDSAGQLVRTPATSPVTRPVSMFAVAAGGRGFSLAIHTVPYLVGL